MTIGQKRAWVIGAVIAIGFGSVVALLSIPGPLSNNWLQSVDLSEIDDPEARVIQAIAPAAQTVLFAIGGLIALIGLALSLDRHALAVEQAKADREDEATRIGELAEQRRMDQERELRARFVTAVELLSDVDKATTRQAGMYALAALADDWAAFGNLRERDVCIEVMCGYLRSAWDPADDATADDERRIRATGVNEIAVHLRAEAGDRSWDGARFNLQNAIVHFDVNASEIHVAESTLDLSGAKFWGGTVSFSGAKFSGGTVSFSGATFWGGMVSFDGATFSDGTVSFSGAKFSSGEVSFYDATFSGGTVSFYGAMFLGGEVSFYGAKFSGGMVFFDGAKFLGGKVAFYGAKFLGGRVAFYGATFSDGTVSFNDAKFSGRCNVLFTTAKFSGGDVSFNDATFSDKCVVSFFDATFSDECVVFFSDATFSSGEVSFVFAKFSGGTVSSTAATFSGECKVSFELAKFDGTVDGAGNKFEGFGPESSPPRPDANPEQNVVGEEGEPEDTE